MGLVSELGQYRLQSQAVNTLTFALCIKTLQTGIGINITHLTSTLCICSSDIAAQLQKLSGTL